MVCKKTGKVGRGQVVKNFTKERSPYLILVVIKGDWSLKVRESGDLDRCTL